MTDPLTRARRLVASTDTVAGAMAELCRGARITITISGDPAELADAGCGMLLAGDHKNGMEFVPLLAALDQAGRPDMYITGKPFSFTYWLIGSLGQPTADLLLPIIPKTLAKDRKKIINRDRPRRLLFAGRLPTESEIIASNADMLRRAATLLGAKNIVSWYPAGGMMDATKLPWQRGIGRVIKMLSRDDRENVRIVMWRITGYDPRRLIWALLVQSCGLVPRTRHVTFSIGPAGTVTGLLGGGDAIDRMTDAEIAGRLRALYVERFARVTSVG